MCVVCVVCACPFHVLYCAGNMAELQGGIFALRSKSRLGGSIRVSGATLEQNKATAGSGGCFAVKSFSTIG